MSVSSYSVTTPHQGAKSPAGELSLTASRRWTRRLARSRRENFVVVSMLLPRRMRQPFYDLYAFCRTADDVADESKNDAEAIERLAEYRRWIDFVFSAIETAGDETVGHGAAKTRRDPDRSVAAVAGIRWPAGTPALFPAFADTVARYRLPKRPLDDLLDAFVADQHHRPYPTLDALLQYCRCSADPVGRLILSLGGCLDEETAVLSDSICTGLQLVNFWQDVRRDASIGRIYVPLEIMDRFGWTASDLRHAIAENRPTPPEIRQAIAHLCEDARTRLQSGLPLAGLVPRWLANDVRLFAHGGLATVAAIEAIDFDVLRQRPVVPRRTQLRLVAMACLGRLR